MEHLSEVARFRQQQALEYEAAQRGLHGLARVASHESIIARMDIGAERLLQLIEAGKHEEALAIMDLPMWGVEEQAGEDVFCHSTERSSQQLGEQMPQDAVEVCSINGEGEQDEPGEMVRRTQPALL
jgi:hypothetical protein